MSLAADAEALGARVGQEIRAVRAELTDVAGRAGGTISNISLDDDTVVGEPVDETDGAVRRYRFTAAGGTRRVTFDSAIVPTTGLADAYDVPDGATLIAALEWVGSRSAWLLIAATVG